MRIDTATHCIVGVEFIESPNFDERPANTEIDLLVIHNISLPPNEFGGGYVKDLFQNRLDSSIHSYFEEIKGMEVSSHLLIERSGKLIQFVPFNKRAWHAGQSCFNGKERCNDFSIGIELEGADDIEYTDAQYDVLRVVILSLQMTYPTLNESKIVGHCEIAPGRKTDPGPAFDWERIN
ncbi:MAG: 1,6-anhydro-N-acetylmuramyl-L-alanine amidase AmpD [Gammaproteobacteria bacterium]|nr:1,6-anhydro-N-acetylmuramyl-L-alanine amidase AmpD [Gammaproteobacteria bacterium]